MRMIESGRTDGVDIPADASPDQVILGAAMQADVDLHGRNSWGIRAIDPETLPVTPSCIQCDQ